jgi:protein gp37
MALDAATKELILAEAPLLGGEQQFNRTNEHVDWAWWTWNPVTGCLHDCDYCYARDIANRFYPQGFTPTFIPARLHAPRHTKVPARAAGDWREGNVFTCSMADLFGKWVPQEWIDAVFAEVVRASEWTFLFLTKFPRKLAEQDWPANAWVGTTVDRQFRVAVAESSFRGVQAGIRWLSCEPLLEPLHFTSLEMFDWVVIGAESPNSRNRRGSQPKWDWIMSLYRQAIEAGCEIYFKENLDFHDRPKGLPVERYRQRRYGVGSQP